MSDLLASARLVTLLGSGGVGKTRLSVAVAHAATGDFSDGVVFIDLSALHDPALVLPTIAATLGVRESGAEPILGTLTRAIGDRRMLFVLDNLEQVVDAARDISTLLTGCPHLYVLATSRIALRVSGEREYVVQPLSVGDGGIGPTSVGLQTGGDVGTLPAVQLFVERARAVRPGFQLTPENASIIAAICQRLDGLPLAIELAAARIKLLTPQAILDRLEQPLATLTGGARDLPERQQSLRHTIAWSHDLLTPEEQQLFRRLSVFLGGWTVERAEAVVNAEGDLGIDVLDGLASLVDKSLVVQRDQRDGEPRFDMLGTIREFGLEQLRSSTEYPATYRRLAEVVAELAGDPYGWVGSALGHEAVILRETGNIHAALGWLVEAHDADPALAIVSALFPYWYTLGLYREAQLWSERVLAVAATGSWRLRSMALSRLSWMVHHLGAYDRARETAEQAMQLASSEDAVEERVNALLPLSLVTASLGDHAYAIHLNEEAVALARGLDNPAALVFATMRLGITLEVAGKWHEALAVMQAERPLVDALGVPVTIAVYTGSIGILLAKLGQKSEAVPLLRNALSVLIEHSRHPWTQPALLALAEIALDSNQLERAMRLLGYADALVTATGYRFSPAMVPIHERLHASGRAALGSDVYAESYAQGATMSIEEVIEEVTRVTPP